jgi:hypothetical protein
VRAAPKAIVAEFANTATVKPGFSEAQIAQFAKQLPAPLRPILGNCCVMPLVSSSIGRAIERYAASGLVAPNSCQSIKTINSPSSVFRT